MYGLKLALPAVFALAANALWDCNSDQHAFSYNADKFVVHYTSQRDSSYYDEPWIRICIPNGDDAWTGSGELGIPCSTVGGKTFTTSETGLDYKMIVGNGDACESSGSLVGTYIKYNGADVDLHTGDGGDCGTRSHGISCQFDLA